MTYEKIEFTKLDYEYDALEPVLSELQVSIHHKIFHKDYVETYNKLLKKLYEAKSKNDINEVLSLTQNIKYNLGAHINHCLYWKNFSPFKHDREVLPQNSTVIKMIEEQWGNLENFKKDFISKIMKMKNSGWGNLVYNKNTKRLEYIETKDEDSIAFKNDYISILCIDGWEHAWSFKYINDKEKYYTEIWKIINWEELERRFQEPQKIKEYYYFKNGNEIKINNIQTNFKSIKIKSIKSRIMYILQLKNGKLAVSSGNALYIYKQKTFELLLQIDKHSGEINSFTELSDGCIVTCSDDKTINVIKLIGDSNYKLEQTLKGHDDYVYKMIEMKEKEYVSISKDTKIIKWKKDEFNKFYSTEFKYYNGSTDSSNILKLNEKEFAITVLNDEYLNFWDINELREITCLDLKVNWPRKNMCLLNEKILGVGGLNDLFLINIEEHQVINKISGIAVTSIIKCSDGLFLCALNENGKNSLVKYDIKLNPVYKKEIAHESKILSLDELNDGIIVSGGEDNVIKFWSD